MYDDDFSQFVVIQDKGRLTLKFLSKFSLHTEQGLQKEGPNFHVKIQVYYYYSRKRVNGYRGAVCHARIMSHLYPNTV